MAYGGWTICGAGTDYRFSRGTRGLKKKKKSLNRRCPFLDRESPIIFICVRLPTYTVPLSTVSCWKLLGRLRGQQTKEREGLFDHDDARRGRCWFIVRTIILICSCNKWDWIPCNFVKKFPSSSGVIFPFPYSTILYCIQITTHAPLVAGYQAHRRRPSGSISVPARKAARGSAELQIGRLRHVLDRICVSHLLYFSSSTSHEHAV